MSTKRFLYLKVYHTIREKIQNKELKPGSKIPSEKELAKEFNVSIITVKRALNLLVEEDVVEKRTGVGSFIKANNAHRLTNNNNLESMVHSKYSNQNESLSGNGSSKKIVGLLMEEYSASFGLELLRSIETTSDEYGYSLCIKRSFGDRQIEENAIKDFMSLQVDGIIIMPTHGKYYSREILKLVVSNFPIVFIDRYLSGISGSFVGSNNKKLSEQLTEHLIKNGHKKIGLISSPPEDAITINDRFEGFISAFEKAHNIYDKNLILPMITSTQPINRSKNNISGDIETIKDFININDNITAIFSTEYDITNLIIKACEDLKKCIPDDLSLVGFDSPSIEFYDNNITHIKQDEETIGKKSIKILHNQILKLEEDIVHTLVEGSLEERLSVKQI